MTAGQDGRAGDQAGRPNRAAPPPARFRPATATSTTMPKTTTFAGIITAVSSATHFPPITSFPYRYWEPDRDTVGDDIIADGDS